MTILFLDQFSDLGGAQQCLLDLLPAVLNRGWRAVLGAPGNGLLKRKWTGLGGVTEPLELASYSSGRKSLADVIRFAVEFPRLSASISGLLKRYRPDLLYLNGPRILPAAARANRDGSPAIFHMHSCLRRQYAVALAGRAIQRPNLTVIASCRFVAEPLDKYASRIHVIYNGVAGCHCEQRSSQPEAPRIGVIGRIAPEKGQHVLAQAARRLPNFRFVITGAPLFGDSRAQEYAAKVKCAAEGLPLEFTGWQEDVCHTLSTLDLLVVPSTGPEATTRVIPEAWSAGVPVVASRIGGIAEIVDDGETGFLFDPGSPDALAQRIREVLSAPADRRRVAANALRVYQQRFTLQRYRDQIVALIAGLLRQEPP